MPEFRPSEARLLYALRRSYLAVEARKQQRLQQLGVLPSHYAVLINVWAHPGVTGAELARHLGVSPQNVANLVARLQKRGLLDRAPHPAHAHVLEVRLTEEGFSLLEAADAEVARLEEEVANELGADRSERLARDLLGIAHQPVDPQ